MDIKQAKDQIKCAVAAYLEKNGFGEYEIAPEEQRPVFMIGAPGIGKTAIMKQISQELGIGLVSYSMTHHTRQSALGLPYITDRSYDGRDYRVSEYTMSEIIASVYNLIEDTGVREGILFLDEVNCVSETLMPSMLQFLQFKTWGGHKIPDGWIVVTAGNPPEYNKSVHQMDVVTMDRLRRIDVEPDYPVWKEYAASRSVHPAIMSYLEIKKDNFYRVESTPSGKIFVTARGWMDLSQALRLYERKDMPVGAPLIVQYLQHPAVSRDFAAYYDLFRKYQADYEVQSILEGHASQAITERARAAAFDERLALVSLLCDAITEPCHEIMGSESMLIYLAEMIREWRSEAAADNSGDPAGHTGTDELIQDKIAAISRELDKGSRSRSMSEDKALCLRMVRRFLEQNSGCRSLEEIADRYRSEVAELRSSVTGMQTWLENVFGFLEDVYPGSQEMLIFVTELTIDPHASAFISHYDSPGYFRHSKELMFTERSKELLRKLENLDVF